MPDERAFFIDLDPDTRTRVRFRSELGQVTRFTVQLERLMRDEWNAVARYDNSHGRPHLDILDQAGRAVSKQWMDGTNSDVMTRGIDDFQQNWKRYVRRFMEGT